MVKSAEDRSCRNLTRSLDGPTGRRILAECQMCRDVVVVGGIGSKDPTQVGFAEDDDVIEAFPTDRTEQAPRGGGPYPEETAEHCPSPGDSARRGNGRHSRSEPAAKSARRRGSPW